MRMHFYVPREFHVFGMPARTRFFAPIECEVVELVRTVFPPEWKWFRNRRNRVSSQVTYTAYVVLPPWVTPPERWGRLISGEVQMGVNMDLNRRVQIPDFPVGVHRIVIDREMS
jgi:hypothetical protein